MLAVIDGALDVTKLQKGDYIASDSLEQHIGHEKGTPKYGLGVMGLCNHIQTESVKEGTPLLVRVENYGIRIMKDADALEYKRTRHRRLCSQLDRTHHDLGHIDRRELDANEVRRLEHEEIRQSRVLQAIKTTVETLPPHDPAGD